MSAHTGVAERAAEAPAPLEIASGEPRAPSNMPRDGSLRTGDPQERFHVPTEGIAGHAANADLLAHRLERLREQGAATFDPPAYGFIATLLERTAALGGGAAAILQSRAETRLEMLEASFRDARRDAAQRMEALAQSGAVVDQEIRDAFEAGDYLGLRRALQRCSHLEDHRRHASGLAWLGRVASRARAQGVRLPPDLSELVDHLTGRPATSEAPYRALESPREGLAGPSPWSARLLGNALSRAMFRETVEAARATFAMARAADNLPDAAGPYNGQVLAARALREMARLSPSYLQVFLTRLDDLAAIEAASEPSKAKAKGARRRRPPAARPA